MTVNGAPDLDSTLQQDIRLSPQSESFRGATRLVTPGDQILGFDKNILSYPRKSLASPQVTAKFMPLLW
jgi:hypothetical protein